MGPRCAGSRAGELIAASGGSDRRTRRAHVGVAALRAAAVREAHTADTIGTRDRVFRNRKIRVTAEVTSPPFGILGRDGQPDGPEIALGRQLARDPAAFGGHQPPSFSACQVA